MNIYNEIFENKKLNPEKLLNFGFKKVDDIYILKTNIMNDSFRYEISITPPNKVITHLFDIFSKEEYILHLTLNAKGDFVDGIKRECETILQNIADMCFETDIFKSENTKRLIKYANETYGANPEFLWQKFPDIAVLRCSDSKKWYALFMNVGKDKLGLSETGKVEILNIHLPPDLIEKTIDGKTYFPAYHMNKKHWITIRMDIKLDFKTLTKLLDESYLLAK